MSLYLEWGNAGAARRGSIEVITGSMFSGKTEELIRRLKRTRFANQQLQVFKPKVDKRYSATDVVSHDANMFTSIPVEHSVDILPLVQRTDVVAIDEAQFFDDSLPYVCNTLANKGIRVIIAGLDLDFKGRPFGPVPALMALADDVLKVHAICLECGRPAQFSYRLNADQSTVLLGESSEYQPLCRYCYHKKSNAL